MGVGETPESKFALYDFIMGALGLGSGFECCRRMGWTEPTDSAT
ncbi:MAG: hypothetical protein JG766_1060, partial [Desulfacinum sp.]|nr:hypothetical protein [Desulfacinum sp.]